jgi:cytochrome c oxidase subunit 2
MPVPHRPRRLLAIALPLLAVALAACNNAQYPNSVFHNHTEFNRDVGVLFKILIWLGTIVFIFVEGLLLYTIFRYRRRSESDRPEHVHGNTTLEILWTAIPALILAFIAVPTVSTIWKTQAKAEAGSLQVEVIGHQWWWEFKYPEYGITTANELYLPVGRKVNFALTTQDVLHSFWIPQLGGKRDLITNHVNHLWFTPDSVGEMAWNGMCAEYCGTSHANMHFKAFTVTPENFAAWVAHQQSPAAFGAVATATPATVAAPGAALPNAQNNVSGGVAPAPTTAQAPTPTAAAGTASPRVADTTAVAAAQSPTVTQAGFIAYPADKLPSHLHPTMPIPKGLTFNESLRGDAERGRALLTAGQGGCLACHVIKGNPMMVGQIGPNLTHIGSRHTIAGALFPNDTKHLAMWIKNARKMKPGVIMPTIGKGEYDPVTKMTMTSGLTDEQIADIVAYLQALK